ncbi:SusC/RagA family TonB-linked outer membrane protein [Neolewinella antarctica]|uniref:TonB-linked SusC/RagA family outer membrane protein n=1 Tax=Neolewinella antarctica TaxID=442734 RepID=A0ABX0XDQ3_9BACT|nr:SusC/RagA family TonB-linked outer membrane protein [Neolewinella antarctica]NJC27446.1 TonB-linked SusC/RagA family outer membrane protein [Neolewinella antarctica]
MKRFSLIIAVVCFAFSAAFAQTVTGTVYDESGESLIGASILVRGTTSGTVTDIDGKFSLAIPANAEALLISYTGYTTQRVPLVAGQTTYEITMAENAQQLGEVVVTALGIERSEKAIGYAVQQVEADKITRSGANSAVDALVGKASGIQVTRSSGSVGAGSRILIRGVTSMIGNNQPLIVIDGVRSNNETQLSEAGTAGTAQANRLMDLNPDDIESVNILKGAAATALYGTSGSTGVVIITTKKGKRNQGLQVNFSTAVGFEEVTRLPDLQNTFSQGSGGSPLGAESGASGSWGGALSDLEYATSPEDWLRQYTADPSALTPREQSRFQNAFLGGDTYRWDKNGFLVPRGQGNGQAANVYDDRLEDVFQTGTNYTNSLSLSGGSDVATFRLSLSSLNAEGIVPNEEYERYTVKLASTYTPIDKLTLSSSMNYTRSDFQRVQQGSNTSGLLLGLLRTPPSFDNSNGLGEDAVEDPSAYVFADNGRQRSYRGGGGYDNPFWTLNNTLRDEGVNRAFGNFRTNYAFNPWVNLDLNVGFDITSDVRTQNFEVGSNTNAIGSIIQDEFSTNQIDVVLNLTGGGQLNEDFGLNYVLGSNAFSFNNRNTFTTGDGFVFPGFVDLSNATNITAGQAIDRFRQIGFIGQAEFNYRRFLYVTLSGRQDYDSRLAAPGRPLSELGFFYPSVALSFAFSELLDVSNSILSFGKLRASYAQVGSPPPGAYQTTTPYETNAIGDGWADDINFPIAGNTGFNLENDLGNSALTPEISNTLELGADFRFWNGRLSLDATWYQVETSDAILPASVAPSTGYTNIFLNAGSMTSDGIELTIGAIPIQTTDFEYSTQINFTRSKSIVNELAPGLERLFLDGFASAGSYIVAGNQYGAIFGGAYQREGTGGDNDNGLNIPEGQIVINDDIDSDEYGYEAIDITQRAIGNPNPDFIIGWNNTVTYKRFSLNWLLDWREGGDMWNGTAWALSFFGASQETADSRVQPAAPLEGVLSDGTPSDIAVVRDQSYWTSAVGGFGSVGEQFVQDGGWVRLREAGLTYRLPATGFLKGGSFGVSARNLFLITDYEGVDPETSLSGTGNGQGFDYFNMPATRSVIFKLNVSF